jgi:hypothetical protein
MRLSSLQLEREMPEGLAVLMSRQGDEATSSSLQDEYFKF